MVFLKSAWTWIRTNWKWLLGPLGVLIWLIARASATKAAPIVVADGAIVGHDEEVAKADEVAAVQKAQSDAEAQAAHNQLDAGHAAAVIAIDKSLTADVDAVRADPDKVNEFLNETSKDMR